MKKIVALILTGILCFGGVLTVSAAELDAAWYYNKYPDIQKQIGDSPEALQFHYDNYGRKEGRMANDHDTEALFRYLFNAEEYAEMYPDIKEYYGDDTEAMFQHYITLGLFEGRMISQKIPYKLAINMRKDIEKAVKAEGFVVTPGSLEMDAILKGDIAAITDPAQAAALSRANTAVFKIVEKVVYNMDHPIYRSEVNSFMVNENI